MKCRLLIQAAMILCLAVMPGLVMGQSVLEDFEGPLPGPQSYPGGWNFSGGANGSPAIVEQITDQVAFSGVQSFQIDVDATNNAGQWWYYGMGAFFGFYGEGFAFAQGQSGEDNPANFEVSFDQMLQGNNGGQGSTPTGISISLWKGDYETVNNIDANNDGDLLDGFDIWKSEFNNLAAAGSNWEHKSFRLNTGTAPTCASEVGTCAFDDEAYIQFSYYFNSGGFGTDAGNVVNLDNMKLEFFVQTITPGDFDQDSDVDGQDFLLWQQTPGVGNLADWDTNYGGGGPLTIAAIPEPSTVLGAAAVLMLGLVKRRSVRR